MKTEQRAQLRHAAQMEREIQELSRRVLALEAHGLQTGTAAALHCMGSYGVPIATFRDDSEGMGVQLFVKAGLSLENAARLRDHLCRYLGPPETR